MLPFGTCNQVKRYVPTYLTYLSDTFTFFYLLDCLTLAACILNKNAVKKGTLWNINIQRIEGSKQHLFEKKS